MANVFDVANHFLKIAAADEEEGEALTHLKLQKLLYYAQGFHMALFGGTALFPGAIQAWDHGPVSPDIYHRFKGYGRDPIPVQPDADDIGLTDDQKELLNDVWNAYGQFSAWKLRNMTHDEAPWKNTYRDGKGRFSEIPPDALLNYFRTQVTDVTAA